MLDSIYHMTLKNFLNHIFGVKKFGFCHTYGRHFIVLPKFVNQCFINLIIWYYTTPRCDVI